MNVINLSNKVTICHSVNHDGIDYSRIEEIEHDRHGSVVYHEIRWVLRRTGNYYEFYNGVSCISNENTGWQLKDESGLFIHGEYTSLVPDIERSFIELNS